MTIIRIVDNEPVEFTLSPTERNKAYWEQQEEWDRRRIMDVLDQAAGDEDSEAEVMWNSLKNCPAMRDWVARKFRDFWDDIPTGEQEIKCVKDAYKYVIKNIQNL